jgi:N-methylhydantoinase A/oxoprolinase/acetone carboxylase beta subunit
MDADGKGGGQAKALKAVRPVYFDGAFVDTPVYDRSKLRAGETIAGPALIEQRDSTTILEPHSKIEIDEYHNMIMETV